MRKTSALPGIGLGLIIPTIETIPYWIDTRAITSSFKAKKLSRKTQRRSMSMLCRFRKSLTPKSRRSMLRIIIVPLSGLPKRLCET